MSAALVRKSLALVEEKSFERKSGSNKKQKNILDLMPINQRINGKIKRKGQKAKNINLIQKEKKLTVEEVKKSQKSKQQVIEENLKKIKLIKEACNIDLDVKVTKMLLDRAVKKTVFTPQKEQIKPEESIFTEEDFKKFEQEYVIENI